MKAKKMMRTALLLIALSLILVAARTEDCDGATSKKAEVKKTSIEEGKFVDASELPEEPAEPAGEQQTPDREPAEAIEEGKSVSEEDGQEIAGYWEQLFKQRQLKIEKARFVDYDYETGTARISIEFGSSVSHQEVADNLDITLNEQEVKYNTASTEDPNKIMVIMNFPSLGQNIKLRIEVEEGLEDVSGDKVVEKDYLTYLTVRPPAKIWLGQPRPKESAGGFYLYVDCDDHSADYYSRCNLNEELLKEAVSFEPEVYPTFVMENYGFRVFGEFSQGKYTMKVKRGLTSESGGVVLQDYSMEFSVPTRSSKASFAVKGRYLPRQRLSSVPVTHINVSRLDVNVRQVPRQNLIYWLSGNSEDADERVSDPLAKREYTVQSPKDRNVTSWLDLSGLVPSYASGVFEFNLSGGDKNDAMRLILTRLSMVAKRYGKQGENIMVWVLDSEELTPRRNVSVELYTKSNRMIALKRTDENGRVFFQKVADPLAGVDKAPFAIVASSGEDFSAMKFSDLELPMSEYEVEGLPYNAESPYRASIYMDRGVYRPGETAHLVTIIWDKNNASPGDGLPMVGKLRDPRGKTVETVNKWTNPTGMAGFDFEFQDFADTGKYTFSLQVGGNEIESHQFHVEEFVPERMKAEAKADAEEVSLTEQAPFFLKARYLFGAKAKGEKMEALCTLDEGSFRPERFPGYEFGVWRKDPYQPQPLGKVEGELDEQGTMNFKCPAAINAPGFRGPGIIKVQTSVFEAGSGRSTAAHASVPVHPDRFYVGLSTDTDKATVGKQVKVEGVVVDWYGNLMTDPRSINIELVQIRSDWLWEYDPAVGRSQWRTYLREMPVETVTVQNNGGNITYYFTPQDYTHGYLVRASAGERASTDIYIKGERYWWYGDMDSGDKTPKPSSPEGLMVNTASEIQVGKPQEVNVTLPYDGRLLFTVETDKVIQSSWQDVKAGPFSTTFVLEDFAPNVYVSALLVKDPHFESETAFIPGRAFGIKSVKVVPGRFKMDLTINAPEEVQPNSTLDIELDTGLPGEMVHATIAAVDEGILQLTRYETPDPLEDMFRKRALAVKTFETVGWTLLFPPKEESTGGGMAEASAPGEQGGRVHAIKPVSLWSGILKADSDGKVRTSFDVPTYRGQLRVVAVATSKNRIGSADRDVYVRDPLVLQPTFPRFLSAEDEFVVPVFLTNMTGAKRTIEVSLQASSAVEIQESDRKSLVLEADESGSVTFLCKAMKTTAIKADLKVTATADGYVSKDSVEMPIIPNGPTTRDVYTHEIGPGENDLTGYMEGWAPQYEKTTVTVLANRYAGEMGHLKYLVRYPYGCIEQTTSTTRPLLFISNILPAIDPDLIKDGSIEEKFMHGVRRLFSMQTVDGGFSYWPGQSASTYWGTAYATHVLLEGVDAGYPINEDRLMNAVSFMDRAIQYNRGRTDSRYGYSVAKSEPYMLFVLAKAGKKHTERIRTLIREPDSSWGEIKQENIFLLKAALYISGDRTYENDLKTASLDMKNVRTNGWTYWSALRTRGMMLNILEDLFPNSEATEGLARSIADRLGNDSRYYTTQELSWCVSGLGKRAGSAAKNWSKPVLTMNGQFIEPLPSEMKDATRTTWQISGASGAKTLDLKVEDIEGGKLYALIQVEGIKPGEAYETGDNGIVVTREYLDGKGNPIELTEMGLGDLVYVKLTLENLTSERILNIAMVDRFGAGFEVENPRLNREHAIGWADPKTQWETEYVNIRDDRVAQFGRLEANQKVTSVYVMRAVLSGRFHIPPVRAEAMYEPTVFSQKTGDKAVVYDPWNAITD